MEEQYDYKSVDWKAVKEEWDKVPMLFSLTTMHGANKLFFQSYLDKTKRYKLGLYINGWMKGEWQNKDHEFQKYFNPKVILPSKGLIEIERKYDKKCKKMTDRQVIEYKEMGVHHYRIPSFSNIAQIKKMVTALE